MVLDMTDTGVGVVRVSDARTSSEERRDEVHWTLRHAVGVSLEIKPKEDITAFGTINQMPGNRN